MQSIKNRVLKLRRLDEYRTRKVLKYRRFFREEKRRNRKAKIRLIKAENGKNWNEKAFFSFLKSTKFVENDKTRLKYIDNKVLVSVPPVFSLMKNPEEVLRVYHLLYQLSSKKDLKGIYFDHSNCIELDIGASTIMDVLVMNLDNLFKRRRNRGLDYSGILPADNSIKVLLFVSGLLNHLNVDPEIKQKIKESIKVELLELINGGKHTNTYRVSNAETSATTSTKITEYFNNCLNTQGIELTTDGLILISSIVAEVIDNCRIHSGEFKQWFTLGHYIIKPGEEHGECNLVIFNFGQTIYEGLKRHMDNIPEDSTDSISLDLKNSLYKLTSLHSKKKFFGPSWNEEVLWTLYALQDGVSRFRTDKTSDRGTGTVEFINAFQQIGDTIHGKQSEMCLISGNAMINFTNKYRISDVIKDGEPRQIIAFNKENDLNLPPDKNNVRLLKNYFPGTILNIKFYIDGEFISQKLEGVQDVDN
ncbi:hypothetical protein M3204_03560 [Mesobacillus subterraneus]|uniref:hypothetical protein n=1 Tax=Mesobacillus subterraneus TaxID=285983 RepID=UPI00203B56D5|nr:hypothetical protein [Mesobacillus subterraneus]MCM3663464.1 hypothetical protein [Mesobacillus subterraneus]MCM3683234.1 hypothetical protein [Mesobacillus subterraneus]